MFHSQAHARAYNNKRSRACARGRARPCSYVVMCKAFIIKYFVSRRNGQRQAVRYVTARLFGRPTFTTQYNIIF